MLNINSLDWQKGGGLLPVIVQDAADNVVLMLGYMNEAALLQTTDSGLVTFFSRSKNRLWTKGESSGNSLKVKNIAIDCDGDTILIQADPMGPTCHTGSRSCFGSESLPLGFLNQLQTLINRRFIERPAQSYTTSLFEAGILKMAQKVGEEGVEVALAAAAQDSQSLAGEAADLIFHLMVLLRSKDLQLADAIMVLAKREQKN